MIAEPPRPKERPPAAAPETAEQDNRAVPAAGASWGDLVAFGAGAIGDRREAGWIVEEVARTGPIRGSRLDEAAPEAASRQVVEMVGRRRRGEPLQHVLGRWAFRTLEVTVDRRALIPRPETEYVTEVALHELDRLHEADRARKADRRLAVVDLGTGSGVIALSIARERSFAEVTATDRSAAALSLAGENARRQSDEVRSRVTLLSGDWYSPLPRRLRRSVAVIVSNPPYVASAEWDELDEVVRHDPYEALVSGETGLEAIEAVVSGSGRWLSHPGALVVEIAPHQAGQAQRPSRFRRGRLGSAALRERRSAPRPHRPAEGASGTDGMTRTPVSGAALPQAELTAAPPRPHAPRRRP